MPDQCGDYPTLRDFPMSATHPSLIVILLSAILAVLLFGREAVFDSASTFLWVVGGSFLLAIVWLLARAFFVEVPKEVISDLKDLRQTGKPWIAEAILIVGLPFGVVWIGGMMAEKYLGYVKQTPYTGGGGGTMMRGGRTATSTVGAAFSVMVRL
jgi:hypothetical protein